MLSLHDALPIYEWVCVAGPLLKLPNEFGAGLVPEKGPRPLPAAWECDLNGDVLTWAPGVFDLFGLPRGCPISRCDTAAMYAPESRALLRSEEQTSELQSLMRISYAVFCVKKTHTEY